MLVCNSSFLPCSQDTPFVFGDPKFLFEVCGALFGKEVHFCPFLDLTGGDILWPLSLPVSLTPLGGTVSTFSPGLDVTWFPPSLQLSSITLCVPHLLCLSSSPSTLRWFCVLALVPSTAVIAGLPLCLKMLVLSRSLPRLGTAGF